MSDKLGTSFIEKFSISNKCGPKTYDETVFHLPIIICEFTLPLVYLQV